MSRARRPLAEYARTTRSGTYGFLAALPLLVAYEVLIVVTNRGEPDEVRVGADVWIKDLIHTIGGTGMFVAGIVVIAVGAAVLWHERRLKLPWRPAWFGGMLAESLVYAFVVAIVISRLVAALFYGAVPGSVEAPMAMAVQDAAVQEIGLGRMLALSLGAGLYEELVFRVVLVTGLAWTARTLGARPGPSYVVAALVGAAVFSAVHYIGAYGDPFTLASFTFRFLFGLALNGLYLARGFGVAAWTHALYDVMVVTRFLG